MNKTRGKSFLARLLQWHQYMGLSIALLVIYLSITGLLLNHTNDFGLDKTYIRSSHVLAWYGIKQPTNLKGFPVQSGWISQWHDTVYIDGASLGTSTSRLAGAVVLDSFIVIATREQLWLLTLQGRLVERLSSPAEKIADIQAIGIYNDRLVIHTNQGSYQADKDLIAWHALNDAPVTWSEAQPVPQAILSQILDNQHSISWERLLLDLHSGRLPGKGGVLLVDLAGFILLLLALTGVTIWFKRRKYHNRKRQV